MMNREKQKKEQKTFEYIENPEQIEGFDKIPVPEDLDQRVRAGIEEGKNGRQNVLQAQPCWKACGPVSNCCFPFGGVLQRPFSGSFPFCFW